MKKNMPAGHMSALMILTLLAAICLGLGAAGALAETAGAAEELSGSIPPGPGPDHKKYVGGIISTDFQGTELHNIVRIIDEAAGRKIVVADEAVGRLKVTAKLKDIPWGQALDIILAEHGLGLDESAQVLSVYYLPALHLIRAVRERQAPERSKEADSIPLAKKMFSPNCFPSDRVTDEFKKIKSPRGKIVTIGYDIYVEDLPEAISAMSRAYESLESGLCPEKILIETTVVEVDASLIDAWGLSWVCRAEPGAESGSAPAAFVLTYLDPSILNDRLTAADKAGLARIFTAPRIVAVNDQKVSIKSGVNLAGRKYSSGPWSPVPAAAFQGGQGTAVAAPAIYEAESSQALYLPASNVQFKEAVMELTIRPHIEDDGRALTLNLGLINDPPRSVRLRSELPADAVEAAARLRLNGGEGIILGGIVAEAGPGFKDSLSAWGRLPLADWGRSGQDEPARELLIFITATIMSVSI